MKIKRYEAETFQKALDEIKKDLGPEAIVLQTRRFTRGGFFGLMGRNMVEVLATLDAEPAREKKPSPRERTKAEPDGGTVLLPPPPPRRRPPVEVDMPPGLPKGTYARPAPLPMPDPAEKSAAEASRSSAVNQPIAPLAGRDEKPLDELKLEIREMRTAIKMLVERDRWSRQSPMPAGAPYPGLFGEIYLKLLEQEVDPYITQDILRFLDESLDDKEKINPQTVRQALRRHLIRRIKTSGQIDLEEGGRKVVALVGPTGSGKTTTLAKLAAHCALNGRKKVGVVTADTYRIAAVEQLKVYGEILDMPVKVVYNSADMKRVLDQFEEMDLILVDTAGRSHNDDRKLRELAEILSVCYPLDIHLVISANTRYRDMIDIAAKFKSAPANHLLFTKVDETSTYGCLFSLICKNNMGVSYIANGQSVPEDLRAATPEGLLEMLMGAK